MNYKEEQIKVEVLATGSAGNAIIINDEILLDCGVTFKKLEQYYKKLKLVFISHVHGDHLNKSCIRKLAQKRPNIRWFVGSWLVQPLLDCGVSMKQIDVFLLDIEHKYKNFSVIPFKLYHDVPTAGIKLFMNNEKLIYATDTNRIDHIEAKGYDWYLIESNYNEEEVDAEIEQARLEGKFCYRTRVKETHLSEKQCEEWLLKNMEENSKFIKMHQHIKKENE